MSKEYIERDDLLNKIGTVPLWTGYREDSYTFELHLALVEIEKGLKKLISELPTADVEPVRHGEWIILDRTEMFTEAKCSCCGHKMIFGAHSFYSNYCPNCGAHMDGGK